MKTAFDVVRRTRVPSRQRQGGVSLLIALLVLVSMTLAGLALIRSVDSATLLAGNLAFRKSAEASADTGMETAIAALRIKTASALEADGTGYYAKVPTTDIDFTGNATPGTTGDDFDWSKAVTVATADAAGNTTAYVIHRLCNTTNTGPLDTATCTTSQDISIPASSAGILTANETYRDPTLLGTSNVLRGLYRITVRISGPRNTFSYVQAIVII
jgi:type IV pilus assembly protein PilX